jgi:hypothetical protein
MEDLQNTYLILISKKPCNLDDSYDWEHGLTNKNEKCHYQTILDLWPIGKVSLNELKFLPYIFCRMTTIIYPTWFYHYEVGGMLILDEFINV